MVEFCEQEKKTTQFTREAVRSSPRSTLQLDKFFIQYENLPLQL
jgi:hypothetical protein